jgi:hypothetical protein
MTDDKRYTRIRFNFDVVKVEFLEASHGGKLYLAGHEWGVTHLIKAANESDAHAEWLDNQPTVPEDELYEAYGFPTNELYDRFCELSKAGLDAAYAWVKWWNEDEQSPRNKCVHNVMNICTYPNRWQEIELNTSGITVPNDFPMLIEDYDYQPNFSGTGVVNIGQYHWMKFWKLCLSNRY